ncbi:MAG: hypothetical protein WDO18_07270 [Acidobacteriota bacterium]
MSTSLWQQPLEAFQLSVAAARPAPAGVATASVTAALGVSLLIKVLRITGERVDLLAPAELLLSELRAVADADVEAVYAYIQTRDARGMIEIPARALRATDQAIDLCGLAAPHIKRLIAADVTAATALLKGAKAAIMACIAANNG